jgi:hypothetical protein
MKGMCNAELVKGHWMDREEWELEDIIDINKLTYAHKLTYLPILQFKITLKLNLRLKCTIDVSFAQKVGLLPQCSTF